ncbi:hypothetical protein COCNU_06G015430 [Cocos nucifera]|uniref:Uncharacterized protein n=1 Tax=Cocos nucifera TaxID=13894 RepID=A0A8K0ICH9_COCNU|nr:hypothetical protein COCNU_06G015430 [Cocos nucifera]
MQNKDIPPGSQNQHGSFFKIITQVREAIVSLLPTGKVKEIRAMKTKNRDAYWIMQELVSGTKGWQFESDGEKPKETNFVSDVEKQSQEQRDTEGGRKPSSLPVKPVKVYQEIRGTRLLHTLQLQTPDCPRNLHQHSQEIDQGRSRVAYQHLTVVFCGRRPHRHGCLHLRHHRARRQQPEHGFPHVPEAACVPSFCHVISHRPMLVSDGSRLLPLHPHLAFPCVRLRDQTPNEADKRYHHPLLVDRRQPRLLLCWSFLHHPQRA